MTDSIRVPLGDEWRHAKRFADGEEDICVTCRGAWPCDAERAVVKLGTVQLALDAATARALAAEEAAEAADRDHRRWVDATYGRDGADSVLLYKSTHAKLEAAWYALATVAQWDTWAAEKVAALQAADTEDAILAAANRTASGDEG